MRGRVTLVFGRTVDKGVVQVIFERWTRCVRTKELRFEPQGSTRMELVTSPPLSPLFHELFYVLQLLCVRDLGLGALPGGVPMHLLELLGL